jgi:hypothetical protein
MLGAVMALSGLAQAAPKEPLVVAEVFPMAGAIDVPLSSPDNPSFAFADFNQTLDTTKGFPSIRLTNVDTGEAVTGGSS